MGTYYIGIIFPHSLLRTSRSFWINCSSILTLPIVLESLGMTVSLRLSLLFFFGG